MINKSHFIFNILLWYLLSLNCSLITRVNARELTSGQNDKICTKDLPKEIDTILSDSPRLSENWGILIQTLDNGKIIYGLNSHKYFIPASNTKLLTTASVLLKLGKDFKITTPVYIQGIAPQLETLIIEGKGDPSLKKQQLETIVKQLKQKKVVHIKEIILIDNYLTTPANNYTWEFSDLYYYYAVPVNSLILEDNTVTLTVNPSKIDDRVLLKWSDKLAGKQWRIENKAITARKDSQYNINFDSSLLESKLIITGTLASNGDADDWWLSIPQPAQYFKDVLVQTLAQNDITTSSTQLISYSEYKSNLDFEDKKLLLEFASADLSQLITTTNQKSDNLYAEVLFKYLAINNDSLSSSESLTNILTNLGISADGYQLKDGSGLSRHNLVTPATLVSLLQLMNDSKYSQTFRNSLTVAGVNGTLKNRFKDTNITNNLFGKTGTLSGVSALSGYLVLENYDDLIFSIMVNQSTASSKSLRMTIDDIILTLGKLDQCKMNN